MKVSDLFYVNYGTSLELNRCKQVENGINFVSRTAKNNGVTAIVNPIPDLKPLEAGLITVAANGSTMSSFVQNKPFYTGYHIFCLKPKKSMTLQEKIFYCICLRNNKYRFSYGRQANQTLKYLELPDMIPKWVNKKSTDSFISQKPFSKKKFKLSDRSWKSFTYRKLFDIQKGKRLVISKLNKKQLNGNCPYVSSIDKNNGISNMIDVIPNHRKNTLTVNYDGSVGEAYYQYADFYASDSVNVLYPIFRFNVYITMFLIVLIKKEKQRYNYGRKWGLDKMNDTTIQLPVNSKNEPDWKFMEDYIKSLPYSSNLEKIKEISS